MTRREIVRLAGTVLLAIVAAMPIGAGMWSLWTVLLVRLPTAIGLLALLGIALAPLQLVRDLIAIERSGRDKQEKDGDDLETLDRTGIQSTSDR